MGAIASKKASASSPVAAVIDSASGGEVRGPVATIDVVPVCRRQPGDLAGFDVIRGCAWIAAVAAPKRRRGPQPARRPPAAYGGRPSHDQRAGRRISACSSPTAFALVIQAEGVERTSSAKSAVRCASSHRRAHLMQNDRNAGFGRLQAASAPASPPPMIWMCSGFSWRRYGESDCKRQGRRNAALPPRN